MSIVIRITITTVAGVGHTEKGERKKEWGWRGTFCPPELYCLDAGRQECLLELFKISLSLWVIINLKIKEISFDVL